MNHQQIDQFDLIDRYLMGKLLDEERASFEAHFVDCPQCIARLRMTKNFLEDLRGVAAAQSWRVEPPPAPRAGGRSRGARRALVLAFGALLLAALVGAIFVINYTRHLRGEADQIRLLAAQWQQRYEDERQAAMAAGANGRQAESQTAAQPRAPESETESAARRETPPAESSRQLPVGGNLPVLQLTSVRGEGTETAAPANQLTVPRAAPVFVLTLLLEDAARYRTYRCTVRDGQGRRVWEGHLKPAPHDMLFAWFNSDGFRSGHYSLIVEGINSAGAQVIANYPFVLNKTR